MQSRIRVLHNLAAFNRHPRDASVYVGGRHHCLGHRDDIFAFPPSRVRALLYKIGKILAEHVQKALDGNVVGVDLVRVHHNVAVHVRAQAALYLESDAEDLV